MIKHREDYLRRKQVHGKKVGRNFSMILFSIEKKKKKSLHTHLKLIQRDHKSCLLFQISKYDLKFLGKERRISLGYELSYTRKKTMK